MKDVMMIWNRFTGRHYSNVNVNQNESGEPEDIAMKTNNLRRKSSIVMSNFINTALAVHARNKRPNQLRSILTLMISGFFAITIGCAIFILDPYEFIFKMKVIFSPGGEIFDIWRKPDIELYVKIYLFNVTNHKEYLSGEESKLKFQETGPYVYRELFEHNNIHFNDNGTVTAYLQHPLQYVPHMSNGTEDDMLILPNIALLSITNVMRNSVYLTRLGLNLLIINTDSEPLVKMTAKEFMFGYQSTLVTLGNKMMPSWIKFDKLGLIDRMYDFENDYINVYTGENDIRQTGLIEKFNGNVNLPQWTGKCANVKGASDGSKFASYIQPNDTILFFRKSLCRSAIMKRDGETTMNGMHVYKYKFVENILDNGAYIPENKCFCRYGYCLKPGLIDVTDCYYGFPIALSYPHFYKADPTILDAIEGLSPNPDLHESFLYVQPKAGLPLQFAFRFQINMALQNIGHMSRVEKFENFVLPLLWFEIGMSELPISMLVRFWFYLNFLPVLQSVLIYLSILAGSVLIGICVRKIIIWQSTESTLTRQWLSSEIKSKKMQILNNRRMSYKIDEMDSSLIESKDEKVPETALDLPSLKEDIV
ncbi:hypothetical protein E2986_04366 [Frieseomelitta varia]|uniref:Scavenger receptor class B member 1 n=1 Tax=Frieseomelitta varia TaxID=561572 RepID=A0A833SB35_9HYME|nr:scavenger receptor class B member 1-like [Frieseomelitta varia]KAF3428525.1 hypothetical protein E2986_04366 [Frieseomelitta varia]